ncbi:PRC-barrel domain-containing protein [Burkholderia alba]|uniref:PRC-barrel domain-containing protein n=1 Tax=Burkholderia alba TaxID=2683677 RepID=UPI002B058C01|nr:PRC-barrel domain-containing protein [Burkholderia alba]
MSGGVPRSVFRLPNPVVTATPVVLATLMLSGCGLLHAPQAPAPITEAVAVPVEPASEPVAAPEPASEPDASDADAQKRPRREVVHPRKIKRPPPVTPPPAPPPPPLITTRAIDRGQVHSLLDSEVQKRGGKVIGRAVDMVADAAGKPREMIVNLQGFMGVGDRKVSFPWSLFRFTPGGRSEPITLDVPAGQLPAAVRPRTVPLAGPVSANAAASRMPILDTDVERPNGAKVGRVIDVLIDRDAQPQAVVLDVSGMVNPDRRAIAASWSALRFAPKDKSLRALLDLNEAQLKASPVYASDKPILAVSPAAPPPAPASAPPAPGASR